MTEREEAIVEWIERAFAGVTLGEGIGMYEAYAIDGGGVDQSAARARDEREDWHRLLQNRDFMEWAGRSQYSFMDALGFRFALPAEMIRSLHTGGEDLLTCHLKPHWSSASLWTELNDEQRACVAAFLRVTAEIAEQDDGEGAETNDWRIAYESCWAAYDRDEERPVA